MCADPTALQRDGHGGQLTTGLERRISYMQTLVTMLCYQAGFWGMLSCIGLVHTCGPHLLADDQLPCLPNQLLGLEKGVRRGSQSPS